jgi:hypothetical protein
LLDIVVPESKVEEARKLIEEYTAGNSSEDSSDGPDER